MLVVREEPLARLIEDDLETMMHAHWKECSIDLEEVPLDPDWPLAEELEQHGNLVAFGLFSDDELVGYAFFEISSHLLHKSTKYAWGTGLYVKPEARKGSAGIKLFVDSEKFLRGMGVQKIVISAPHASALNRVLEAAEYRPSEHYYSKLVN